jgi:hypothetical protein
MTAQKQKGTAAETATLRYLTEQGILALRNPPAGSKDKGDITVYLPVKITLEVKNHKRMELAQWVDESVTERDNAGTDFGVVVHKRVGKGQPKDWYVTLTLEQFTNLLKLL